MRRDRSPGASPDDDGERPCKSCQLKEIPATERKIFSIFFLGYHSYNVFHVAFFLSSSLALSLFLVSLSLCLDAALPHPLTTVAAVKQRRRALFSNGLFSCARRRVGQSRLLGTILVGRLLCDHHQPSPKAVRRLILFKRTRKKRTSRYLNLSL